MNRFNHCEKLQADPFMCLIAGGTGSGKTYLLFQMLTTPDILDYERLVILTTTPNQPYFQFLKYGFENNLEKSAINKLCKFYIEGDVKGNIDEICCEASKCITQRETIITQLFYDVEKIICKNANVFILFKQSDKSLTCILQSIKTDLPNEDFKQLTN